MKNDQDISKREKSAAVGLVVCFVAMIAIVGMITFSQYERRTEEQRLAEAELAEAELAKAKESTENSTKNGVGENMSAQMTNTDTVQAEIENQAVLETPEEVITPAPIQPKALSFSAEDTLIWPVDGNVLLSYSMDKTVYFSTLDQYKYNPALVIGGEVGQDVLAAAEGEVVSIETNAQTGITLTMDLGDGYHAVYGQLKDVCVEEGSRVSQGDVIAYLNEPTKYYSVEGANLYFQVLKDGDTVNPMEYLEA